MGATAEAATEVGRDRIIERPRLTRLLDETSARVIMLVAPAGYGKTTLARQWLENRPHAWYQAGVGSSDVAAVALGLAEAAETLLPGVGRRLREWLPTSRGPEDEVDVIERFLSEDLAEWPDDAWFVIDDYQFLSSFASDDLVRRLFAGGERRLLLTSRQRPSWASARELLYGNAFELGQSSLAMNVEEANAVLSAANPEAAGGLVALADGWPAVIGLAALMPNKITFEAGLPEELHDYFAEELFASLPEETRSQLCRLALVPVVSRDAAEAMLGPEATDVVKIAREAGMFTSQRGAEPTFHPLLRRLLVHKLQDLPRGDVTVAVTHAADFLIRTGSWGEGFSLISGFGRHDLLDSLLAQGIVPLTKQGRLATLREWVDFATQHEISSPYRELAEAHLCFHQGVHSRATALGLNALDSLSSQDALRSRAHFLVGQAGYLLDEPDRALEHFRRAEASAQTPHDLQNALWGQFAAAIEREDVDAQERLKQFATAEGHNRETAIRAMVGELVLAIRWNGLTRVRDAALLADDVGNVSDPAVRSSFWHIYAAALALASDYADSLAAVHAGLHEIDASYIEFARLHLLMDRASACLGLKRFRESNDTLAEIEKAANVRGDDYVLTNTRMIRCRLGLYQGMAESALDIISRDWTHPPARSMQAEFLATRAAAFACNDEPETALSLIHEVERLSNCLEPQLLSMWVRTICYLMLNRAGAGDLARRAYDRTCRVHAFDTFVFAYRVHPELLGILAREVQFKDSISTVLAKANDQARGRSCGLRVTTPSDPAGARGLTKREQEVYRLLAEGQTNREIAAALVISEPTAKVHVRNVLRKLGVKSRTHAALKAVRDETNQAETS